MIDSICEHIWINGNIDNAIFVLDNYPDYISDYGLRLLCETIFGIEIDSEYLDFKPNMFEKFSSMLTSVFDKLDFYRPTKLIQLSENYYS